MLKTLLVAPRPRPHRRVALPNGQPYYLHLLVTIAIYAILLLGLDIGH